MLNRLSSSLQIHQKAYKAAASARRNHLLYSSSQNRQHVVQTHQPVFGGVRNAEDFKADSVPFLVHALQQGAGLFSPEDQKRVVAEAKSKDADA
ncbi:hypothetical protein NW762_012937 [Fusarium torreyae]|uniref:Ribosome-assembly protein 3 C-terminal domain-containing protein n=1 Tax=Fusarium torreyae TaxID=1237075 RepID=A0A9W8V7U3_9HYPO|nr:hypothetical protein NW762_012937 [Fusarium torreyae]